MNPETEHTAPQPSDPDRIGRRNFLATLSFVLGGIGALLVGIPVVGFLFAPLLTKKSHVWRSVGTVQQFKVGETVNVKLKDASPLPWAGMAAQTGAWLRRESDQVFIAFTINCSHLGCPVHWLANANLFMCPCHGGVYYRDGTRAAGPPPRGLARYPVRIRENQVEIKLSPVPLEGLPTAGPSSA